MTILMMQALKFINLLSFIKEESQSFYILRVMKGAGQGMKITEALVFCCSD